MDMSREPEKQPKWIPHTDVFVTDAGLTILIELAGIRKEDLELTVESQRQFMRAFSAKGVCSRPDGVQQRGALEP